MADTDTTRNLRWPWVAIVIAALLVAAVFLAVERDDGNNSRPEDEGSAALAPASGVNAPVQAYVQFAGAAGTETADVDHEFMADGLRTLAGAMGTLNLGSVDLHIDLRVAAEHILLNPASSATTEVVRNGLIAAAAAIEAERQDDGEDDLTPLAQSLQADVPLIDQRTTVQMFFRRSAVAIERIAGGA